MDLAATPAPPADVPARTAAPRRPWIAALLSLLLGEGLGHLYAGRARRGLVLTAALFTSLGAALLASMVAPTPASRVLLLATAFVVKLGIAWDAAIVATAANRGGWVPRRYNRWYVYVGYAAALMVLTPAVQDWLREHVARAYTIPSLSMEPTLLRGDYILAAPLRSGPVARGTPVVHQWDDGIERVARAVGLPGDTLEMRGKVLFVNGGALRETYARHTDTRHDPASDEMQWQREFLVGPDTARQPTRDRWGPLVVPDGHYFVLGDNRDNAYDSRYLGFISRERLVRRPVWIYLSRNRGPLAFRWSRTGREIR